MADEENGGAGEQGEMSPRPETTEEVSQEAAKVSENEEGAAAEEEAEAVATNGNGEEEESAGAAEEGTGGDEGAGVEGEEGGEGGGDEQEVGTEGDAVVAEGEGEVNEAAPGGEGGGEEGEGGNGAEAGEDAGEGGEEAAANANTEGEEKEEGGEGGEDGEALAMPVPDMLKDINEADGGWEDEFEGAAGMFIGRALDSPLDGDFLSFYLDEDLKDSKADFPELEVGVLSRGESPEEEQADEIGISELTLYDLNTLRPTTPDLKSQTPFDEADLTEEESEPEEAAEPEEEEPHVTRKELAAMYREQLDRQKEMEHVNELLQHKLAQYFQKKKTEDKREGEKSVTDQEQRYFKCMKALDDLQDEYNKVEGLYERQIKELKEKLGEKVSRVDEIKEEFVKFKKETAVSSENTKTGKSIPPKMVESFMNNEAKKDEEVKAVRLENIKLRSKLRKREAQLKQKEELADGLHLIDFEQLKIENQTYNEKIEERNEELLKLRKKITNTVQVLTHIKEKLQFVQGENVVQRKILKEVEERVSKSRDNLSRTKQTRDSLRTDNTRLRQKSGLVGNEPLLRDYEEKMEQGEWLRTRLDTLKKQHNELVLQAAGYKKKIERVGN
eukprot:Nk52_evm7s322 gene=Nk52_evmTU7s322